MGSTDSRAEANEKNVHAVKLSSFLICDHEVTRSEYKKFCIWSSTSDGSSQLGSLPDSAVGYVSYNDAIVYCNLRSVSEGLTPCYSWAGETDVTKWRGIQSDDSTGTTVYCGPTFDKANIRESEYLTWNKNITCDFSANGYRLPTEAEWECAARGGIKRTDIAVYPGTTDPGSGYKNLSKYMTTSGDECSSKIKQKLPNGYGLYDMAGNVWEWCWDWYAADYPTTEQTDPTGPATFGGTENRVYRGSSNAFKEGGTNNGESVNYFRVSYRGCYNIENLTYGYVGIRLVRSVR